MDQLTVTGMVLSAAPIGDYDRRLVLLTKERGKISAFARGARRPNSALVGALSPFSFGKFTIYQGRSSYTIQSAEVENYFSELREDIEGAYFGFYFLEFANYFTRENNDERSVLMLLYQSLRALTNKYIPNMLVRYIFELKMYYIEGIGPEVYSCVNCGMDKGDMYFSPLKGGILCGKCKGEAIDSIKLHESTIYTMQFIRSKDIQHLYTFNVTDEVLKQLEYILERYRNIHIDKEFNSLEILKTIVNM